MSKKVKKVMLKKLKPCAEWLKNKRKAEKNYRTGLKSRSHIKPIEEQFNDTQPRSEDQQMQIHSSEKENVQFQNSSNCGHPNSERVCRSCKRREKTVNKSKQIFFKLGKPIVQRLETSTIPRN
jgi:hypothetical protein